MKASCAACEGGSERAATLRVAGGGFRDARHEKSPPRSRSAGVTHLHIQPRVEWLVFPAWPAGGRGHENARWLGHRATFRIWMESLDDAEHDGSDKGKRDIRGDNAQSADESHGNSLPWFTSCRG